MAALPPDGELSFLEGLIAAGSALFGALIAAGGLIWHRAGKEASMMGDIASLRGRQDKTDVRLDSFEHEQNKRHEANIRAIALLPDKEDFRHFQSEINQRLAELKDIVMRATR